VTAEAILFLEDGCHPIDKNLVMKPKREKTSSLPKVTTFINFVVSLQYHREFNFH
jgi:hypothetical protein